MQIQSPGITKHEHVKKIVMHTGIEAWSTSYLSTLLHNFIVSNQFAAEQFQNI